MTERAKKQFQVTKYAPDFAHIHPVDPTRPEESIFLLSHGLYHGLFHAPMPDYQEWFAARDATPDYEYLRQALRVLQFGRRVDGGCSSTRSTSGQMRVIKKVFPGAIFVWTHCDPGTVIGSTCSLADLCRSLFVADGERLGVVSRWGNGCATARRSTPSATTA